MNKVHYSSKQSEWGTPQRLFDELNREFWFERDTCANRKNFKVTAFWDKNDNALKRDWSGVLWMNPPYGRAIGMWLKKAYEEISEDLAKRAEAGEFSDFESEHALPKIELVGCLNRIYKDSGNLKRAQLAHNLAREVMEGKWDETREESEAWFQREGKDLLRLHREAKP